MLFKTSRTQIRPFQKDDFEDLFQLLQDSEMMQYTGFRTAKNKEESLKLLNKWIPEGYNDLGVWAVTSLNNNSFIGWFMLKIVDGPDPELGFMIKKSEWGQGYATEVSQGFLNYAFQELKKERVVASVDSENIASLKVLQKIGMQIFKKSLKEFETLHLEIARTEITGA